jgi:hypothetical protein
MSASSADALRGRDVNVRTTPLTCGCLASVATRIRIRISSLLILNFRTFAQRCFRDYDAIDAGDRGLSRLL